MAQKVTNAKGSLPTAQNGATSAGILEVSVGELAAPDHRLEAASGIVAASAGEARAKVHGGDERFRADLREMVEKGREHP